MLHRSVISTTMGDSNDKNVCIRSHLPSLDLFDAVVFRHPRWGSGIQVPLSYLLQSRRPHQARQ